ncbi:MAG: sigma-70 family RNA polymerase sigma factor [Bacteroidota bacterium]
MYQEIIQGCKQQKPQYQRQLYERFAPKMLGVCYRYAHSREEAEDMLQEGFIKVFQKIHKYDDRGSLEGWIRRLMVNNAIDHLRKQKHYQQQLEINEAITEEVSEDALDQLEVEFLYRVVHALPAGYRAIFNLYAIEGYSHAEIAAQLNISESTSRSQYTRARALLKKRISEAYMETNLYRDVC